MQTGDAYSDLMRLISGFQVSQAISVAATLRIADLLSSGPRSSEDLAAATETDPSALYRLLRALAAAGIFRETEDCRFGLTPMAECLRSDAPQPAGPLAAFIGRPHFWNAWGDLLHSVRTGESAFRRLHGMNVWEFLAGKAEESDIFNRAMAALSCGAGSAVGAAYDFGAVQRIVDVGGGNGALLAEILRAHPNTRAVLFEQPQVAADARVFLEAAGVADRCDIVGGDFFENVPEADILILKSIIHDWDDAAAVAILRVCRRAIASQGKLLIIERVVAPPNEAPEIKFSDLNMLVLPGGQERTRDEFAELFAAAAFRLTNVIPTRTRWNVIEGEPV